MKTIFDIIKYLISRADEEEQSAAKIEDPTERAKAEFIVDLLKFDILLLASSKLQNAEKTMRDIYDTLLWKFWADQREEIFSDAHATRPEAQHDHESL